MARVLSPPLPVSWQSRLPPGKVGTVYTWARQLLFTGPQLPYRAIGSDVLCVSSFDSEKFSPLLDFSARFSSARRRNKWPRLNQGHSQAGGFRMEVQDTVKLTEKEGIIFNKLLATLRHNQLSTQLRVAGGWVRDKLLGKHSTDIDIALDNMLGSHFCAKVNEYLKSIGEQEREFCVIKSNPEQSKHLEAAHMRLHGVAIDFVNLRAEAYTENSRIPSMTFGTAEEDAYRRDLTINSLFYNINTSTVEDFTKRGLQDLKDGVIATPLPPLCTFLDDPLRVLRAVRFGARFDYQLNEELKHAAASEDVKVALGNKVSRERIGNEIDLMLKGNNPVKAMRQLADLNLFPIIFSPPVPVKTEFRMSEDFGSSCVEHLEEVVEVLKGFGPLKLNLLQERICLLSALLFPLHGVVSQDAKGKPIPLTTTVIRESLKLKAKDAEEVFALHAAAVGFESLSTDLGKESDVGGDGDGDFDAPSLVSKQRVKAGLLLREIKDLWRVALLLSSLLYKGPVVGNVENPSLSQLKKSLATEGRVQRCLDMEKRITSMGLEKVWEVKPLLDGRAVMNLLGLKSGGPQVKVWTERMIMWQLANPDGTAEDCRDWFQGELQTSKRIRVS